MDSLQDTWQKLRPLLTTHFTSDEQRTTFMTRLEQHYDALIDLLQSLYGDRPDFAKQVQQIVETAAKAFIERPRALRMLDANRDPRWFQHERMVGGMCYVDLYAGNLKGIRARIPYFQELGLTYLHLMPLFLAPVPENDGGYAVSSFRQVRQPLGTMQELSDLAVELRATGISLVLDMVMNHTSDEHEWALRAKQGDTTYQDYYLMFPDETLPTLYQQNLREIFPEKAPGGFTFVPEVQRWVWTTFHRYQWDLNYANPAVFNAMLGEMLFLANQGVEVLRLDAVPFLWKQLGTSCENLPQAHTLMEAYAILFQIVAPATIFKSEAIVHPDEVVKYVGSEECTISYNPLLMVLMWEAMATGWTHLLQHSMIKRFNLPPGTSWVNYIRSHDDIGWGFANEDCAEVGIDGGIHRIFLNRFYTGQVEGSFAIGLPFGYNPQDGDMRICGTTASLAGLEQALGSGDGYAVDMAIRRILLMMGIILTVGGIPLLYLGDEVGTLNDYSYRLNPAKADDNRWVHRPYSHEQTLALRHNTASVPGRIFTGVHHMIAIRKSYPIFSAHNPTTWLNGNNPHIALFTRQHGKQSVYVATNFSTSAQTLNIHDFIMDEQVVDLLTQATYQRDELVTLAPYDMVWLCSKSEKHA